MKQFVYSTPSELNAKSSVPMPLQSEPMRNFVSDSPGAAMELCLGFALCKEFLDGPTEEMNQIIRSNYSKAFATHKMIGARSEKSENLQSRAQLKQQLRRITQTLVASMDAASQISHTTLHSDQK
jgi:hypothetical protein